MIGSLRGEVTSKIESKVIIEVGGVGYRVIVSKRLGEKIVVGKQVQLLIHTHVREDELSLYGFEDQAALKMFELLISVSGVGPKMAMNILAKGDAGQIQKAVAMADVSFFTSVSGIGKKNGQRIIVDLKSKLGDLQELDLGGEENDELVAAVVGMGFERKAVVNAVGKLPAEMSEDEKLKKIIKMLGKK